MNNPWTWIGPVHKWPVWSVFLVWTGQISFLFPELNLISEECTMYVLSVHDSWKKWCEWYFYWLAISCRLEIDIKLLWFWSICKFPFIIYSTKTDSWTPFFDANVLIFINVGIGFKLSPALYHSTTNAYGVWFVIFTFVELRIPSSLYVELYSLWEHICDVANCLWTKWHLPS